MAFPMVQSNNNLTDSRIPIDNIIVLSQGQRSFDNYFGSFPNANGILNSTGIPINPFENLISFENFSIYLEFKSNITNYSKNGFLINKGGVGKETSGNNLNFGLWIDKNEHIVGGFETTFGKDYFVKSKNKYDDLKWHNIFLIKNNSHLKLYIDNQLQEIKYISSEKPDDNKLPFIRVGSNFLKTDYFFIGNIGEIRLWNHGLSSKELKTYFERKIFPNDEVLRINLNNNSNSNYQNESKTKIYFNGSNYIDIRSNEQFSDNQLLRPFHLNTFDVTLKYGLKTYERSYNNGFMDGFIYAQNITNPKNNSSLVMGYYDSRDIPLYWFLASEFALADNFFSPSRFSDLSNNLYLYAADDFNYKKYVPKNGLTDINTTIFDILNKNNISWKIYVEKYDRSLNYTKLKDDKTKRHLTHNPILGIPRFVDDPELNSKIVDINNFFVDVRENNLPNVSYIVTPYSHETTPKDIHNGQLLVANLLTNLMKSNFWKNSVFILTYSGTGGWYDHVSPPSEIEDLGFRVPTLLISPYSKSGFIDNTFYDSTSILKFIESVFNISSINERDRNANNLLNSFEFNNTTNNEKIYSDKIFEIFDQLENNTFTFQKNIEKTHISDIFLIYFTVTLSLIIIIIIYLVIRKVK
ncbi:MAG: alkaline phosphatase family protein [Nitrososphaeraceae archaeon]